MDKAKCKVATEIKRCELNMAINEKKTMEVISSIADDILRIADGKYELSEILDSVAYKKYVEYMEKLMQSN
ncbi:hypothetical protein EAL2_c02760 [Peptoclostridium acidaminophilum DSM 3953]|uniref:Uncharacterized protein n=1 Tax=Peptoclostridium acidaminophilum DSM 3953 TaxID=1286171 RepID=W8T1G3_PEPAC|nr:hypothetical protein [Peptoclostridium acidaminophilum]AHM55579.1 hypothetical protein EAL2_c02760 [Peptoclostridium acidaminophilum DSM 3953]